MCKHVKVKGTLDPPARRPTHFRLTLTHRPCTAGMDHLLLQPGRHGEWWQSSLLHYLTRCSTAMMPGLSCTGWAALCPSSWSLRQLALPSLTALQALAFVMMR